MELQQRLKAELKAAAAQEDDDDLSAEPVRAHMRATQYPKRLKTFPHSFEHHQDTAKTAKSTFPNIQTVLKHYLRALEHCSWAILGNYPIMSTFLRAHTRRLHRLPQTWIPRTLGERACPFPRFPTLDQNHPTHATTAGSGIRIETVRTVF